MSSFVLTLISRNSQPSVPTQVNDIASLRSLSTDNIDDKVRIYIAGYYGLNDGGQGYFIYDKASIVPENGGVIVSPSSGHGRWNRCLQDYISPEMFGMVGDGVTDDYPAWQALVSWVNTSKFSYIRFASNKTYYFGSYITAINGVSNVAFQSIDGLTIEGSGSTIKVQGSFVRGVNTTNTLSGLIIWNSKDVTIRNVTLHGSCDTITKTGSPAEGGVWGLLLGSCTKVIVQNVNSQYWITDGFYISDGQSTNPRLASREVHFINCQSLYNGRQGLSIIQLYGGIFENCVFSYTGQSSYGLHSPGAGVDIEPNRDTSTASPNQMDVDTGELKFVNCRFYFNAGCSLTSSHPDHVHDISYERCRFEVGVGNIVSSYGFINDSRNVTIRDCYFDMADRGLYLAFSSDKSGYINFIGNTVKGSTELIRFLYDVPSVVKDNRFLSTWTVPQNGKAIYVANSEMTFTDNYTFLPANGYLSDGAGGRAIRMQLLNCARVENNRYETDLVVAASGGGGTAHYAHSYSDGPLYGVRNEVYLGTAPGIADTIRPVYNGAVDTRYPFSLGTTHGGDSIRLGQFANSRNMTYLDSIPVTGLWNRGDIVWNNSPIVGGPLGWSCVTGGNPGAWKATANIAP